MGFGTVLRVSGSALTAERLRMDVIAGNIANAHTTGPQGPYQRRRVVFRASPVEGEKTSFCVVGGPRPAPAPVALGVRVVRVETDPSPGQRVYDPAHPDADDSGYVTYPNVDVVTEMVDLLTATRAYEANANVIAAARAMAAKALAIGGK